MENNHTNSVEFFGCKRCRNNGYFVARHKESLEAYAFRCSCASGVASKNAFPLYEERHKKIGISVGESEFMNILKERKCVDSKTDEVQSSENGV